MGAFGDTLLLALLFKQLLRHYENAHIALAANPSYAAPLLDSGLFHKILDGNSSPFHLMYNDRPQKSDDLSRLIEHYDKCMFYTSDISGELVKRLNINKLDNYCIHPPFPPASEEVHICEWMMRPWPFLKNTKFEKLTLKPSQNNLVSANQLLSEYGIEDGFFSIHPGGGGNKKWVPHQMLATHIQKHADKTGQQPVLLEGPADSVASQTFRMFWNDSITIIRDASPKILSAIFSKSSAYFGGDSGVSHLASLYAPSTTIFYGPDSNIRIWHPIGSNTRCVRWESI